MVHSEPLQDTEEDSPDPNREPASAAMFEGSIVDGPSPRESGVLRKASLTGDGAHVRGADPERYPEMQEKAHGPLHGNPAHWATGLLGRWRGRAQARGNHAAPALLTMADFYGTLAAVRALGRAGLPVAVAASSRLAVSNWSRYTTERLACPRIEDPDAMMDWLFALGRGPVRYALLATSDDTAWLFSRHQAALARSFHLHQPPLEAIYGLLNKQLLHDHCQAESIPVPRSWFPADDLALRACAQEADGPVLIKPRTQILFPSSDKGWRVERPSEIASAFRRFSLQRHARALLEADPDADRPMIQQFHSDAERGIYNLSGYAGEDGRIWALRAGRKVLQRPRRIGIGLCFEDAPVNEWAAAAVQRLVDRTGYFGVFESEFIVSDDRLLLIDFNPRFYSQMAFDEDRGLPLALLAYHTALGDRDALSRIRGRLSGWSYDARRAYSHRVTFELMLAVQGLAGTLGRDEVKGWRKWHEDRRGYCTDAAFDRDDLVPAALDAASTIYHYSRHPRSTYRLLVRNL